MKTAADLPIVKDCPLEGELPGEGPRRHCAACDTLVVDLSLLTANDADALLQSPARPRCVSYLVDERGSVMHLPPPPPAPAARRRLPILAGAMLLAACNGAPAGDPAPTATSAPVVATAATAAASNAPAPLPLRGEIDPTVAQAAPAASADTSGESCEHDKVPPAASAPRPHAPTHVNRPIMKRGKPMRIDDPSF